MRKKSHFPISNLVLRRSRLFLMSMNTGMEMGMGIQGRKRGRLGVTRMFE